MRHSIFLLIIVTILFFLFGCPNGLPGDNDTTSQTYTVTYDGNGADGGTVPTDSNTYEEGDTVTVLGNTGNLTKSEYMFSGWNTKDDGSGTKYNEGDTFTIQSSTVTLYAQWVYDISLLLYTEMVQVAGGSYTQEDVWTYTDDAFNHTISSFAMGKYEVTYELWYTVRKWALLNGYTFSSSGREGEDGLVGQAPTAAKFEPVSDITWRDAIVWCNAYSEISDYTPVYYTDSAFSSPLKTSVKDYTIDTTPGSQDNPYVKWTANGYRLPTEGEWQYAASSKGTIPYTHASGATAPYTDETATAKVAWYRGNSGATTHDVGTTTNSSALNLWDVSGNVMEWCWDWYGSYPSGPQIDYKGPSDGEYRVYRGGDYDSPLGLQLVVGERIYTHVYIGASGHGLRVARTQ